MSSTDDFDPTHALDGWRAPAPAAVDLQLASLRPAALVREAAAVQHRGTVVAEPAGFEPTRALDGWHAPAPAPLDLELRSLQRSTAAKPDEAKKAWLKKRGFEMVDVEDIDVPDAPRRFAAADAAMVAAGAAAVEVPVVEPPAEPDIELPLTEEATLEAAMPAPEAPEPPPAEDTELPLPIAEADLAPELDFRAPPPPLEPDPQELIAAIELPDVPPPPATVDTPTLDFRTTPPAAPDAEQLLGDIAFPAVPPPPTDVEVPLLDLPPVAAPAELDPRLLAQWQPQAWVAQVRRIAGASVEVLQGVGGPRVDNHAPQWLCALWPPQRGEAPLLARWPELAAVVAADTADAALQQLLPDLPAQAELWRADKRDADWALLADLVLHREAGLRPDQTRALRDLAEAERSANLLHMTHDYLTEGRLARRRA